MQNKQQQANVRELWAGLGNLGFGRLDLVLAYSTKHTVLSMCRRGRKGQRVGKEWAKMERGPRDLGMMGR